MEVTELRELRILFANVFRVSFGAFWTTACGLPLLAVIGTTYLFGWLCERFGRGDILDAIVEWNATVTGWIAQNIWAHYILATCGITVRTREAVPIDWQSSHVLCANHASIFDILALVRVIPPPFRFVAKRELLRWPVIGWALRPSGQIVIDRRDRAQSVQMIEREASRKVRGQVIFFVEGTRSRTGELLPFKRGAFHFAVDRRVPALPTAICGSFGVLGRTSWWWLRPNRAIEIRFAAPIAPPQASDPAAVTTLLEQTRAAIEAELSSQRTA